MENMKVSIITVCYNSEKTIRRTIESVLYQTYNNIEYIIVDGASKDGTINIVNEYKEAFKERLIVVSEPDDGIYYAMNKGIRLSTGKLIGIINSDDWYEEDAIEKIVRNYNERHVSKYEVYYGMTGIIKNGNLLTISKSSHEKLEEDMISHPSCFITKETYEKYGAYDIRYPCVADYDLMLRYKRNDTVRFIPVEEHIANFTVGGMSSTGKAYIDLLKLRVNYGKIARTEAKKEIIKAKIAIWMEKHGMKPIEFRKR